MNHRVESQLYKSHMYLLRKTESFWILKDPAQILVIVENYGKWLNKKNDKPSSSNK